MDVLDKGAKRQQKSVRTVPLCHAEPFGNLRVNSVKHLLLAFSEFFETEKERQKQILRRYGPQNHTFLRLESAIQIFVAKHQMLQC